MEDALPSLYIAAALLGAVFGVFFLSAAYYVVYLAFDDLYGKKTDRTNAAKFVFYMFNLSIVCVIFSGVTFVFAFLFGNWSFFEALSRHPIVVAVVSGIVIAAATPLFSRWYRKKKQD